MTSSKSSKTSAKKSSKPPSNKTSASKKTVKAASKPKTSQGKKAAPPPTLPKGSREWLSLNRSLDIAGIIMTFIGLLTLFGMLSATKSGFFSGWEKLLHSIFGLGMYVFPFGMIAGGLLLLLRNFDRAPRVSTERIIGIILLYIDLLGILTFIYLTWGNPGSDPWATASAGEGGGYIGTAVYMALKGILGIGGTAVALIAWLMIALAMTLDVTVMDLLQWIPAVTQRFRDWLAEAQDERRARQAETASPSSSYQPTVQTESQYRPAPPTPTKPFQPENPAARQVERSWILPPIDRILEAGREIIYNDELDLQRARLIEETLASFGAPARVIEINRGPAITQFGVEPDFVETRAGRTKVRVGKIASLVDDLALALSARTIRVQAPVPGKGFVGIEVPNEEITVVALRDVIESEAYKRLKSNLRFALGQNVSGNAVAADLSAMPHLLIAGQTGSGKSVCVNALISCLLLSNTPDDLRFIMVDPKRVELTGYNGIPHLLAPVVVEMERVVSALQWVLREMDMRYRKLAEVGSRNIQDYNAKMLAQGQKKLPYLVVIIDELADLMIIAPDETERSITRLAQLARATGIHLVIATQRPSVDVVTGLIKANFPARIAFAVASGVDSRVVLDQPGAERLLGRGDMLFQAPDSPAAVRLQGAYVSDTEIFSLVSYWQSFAGLIQPAPTALGGAVDTLPGGVPLKQMSFWDEGAPADDEDPLLAEAIDLARRQGRG
jgi:S-DNA-T family DNA segregation ATPase FtsK/SpoIIIE